MSCAFVLDAACVPGGNVLEGVTTVTLRPQRNVAVEVAPPPLEDASKGSSRIGVTAVSPHLDELDMTLIRLLMADGRMSNRELAAAAGVSNATVGARIRRLVDDRVLIFTALFDWEAAGYEWFAIAKFGVEGRSPRAVAEELASLPHCQAVALVFGDYDILAYFLVTNRTELHRLIEAGLASVAGISSVSIDLATESTVTGLGRQFFLARGPTSITMPNPVVDLDELDIGIMHELLSDGRQSSRNIARRLDVSEGTVRARIHAMVAGGLMRIVAMVEPFALGLIGVVASVGLRVERAQTATVIAKIRELPQTIFVAVTVGSADISVTIGAADQSDMLDIVLNQIRTLPGVRSTETLQMVEVVRFSPYLKRLD